MAELRRDCSLLALCIVAEAAHLVYEREKHVHVTYRTEKTAQSAEAQSRIASRDTDYMYRYSKCPEPSPGERRPSVSNNPQEVRNHATYHQHQNQQSEQVATTLERPVAGSTRSCARAASCSCCSPSYPARSKASSMLPQSCCHQRHVAFCQAAATRRCYSRVPYRRPSLQPCASSCRFRQTSHSLIRAARIWLLPAP